MGYAGTELLQVKVPWPLLTQLTPKVIQHMHPHFHDGNEGADASKDQPKEENGTEHSAHCTRLHCVV